MFLTEQEMLCKMRLWQNNNKKTVHISFGDNVITAGILKKNAIIALWVQVNLIKHSYMCC